MKSADTEYDEFRLAIDRLNAPFPAKVSIASSYGVPIFNTGLAYWHIVDASGTGEVVATLKFSMVADPKDRMSWQYLKAVEARAQRLADVINAGLQAQQQTS